MREARVAIVVTCFNDGQTLIQTLASIRQQLEGNELVVVDDGSTDALTLKLLGKLESDGLSVIWQENQGQAAAAMRGVLATSAPLVMRFDSDDLLEPGALTALVQALEEHPDAAVAWGDFTTFGLTTFRVPTVPVLDPWLITYVNCVPGSGCLVRRSALDHVGGWRMRQGYEDW